MSNKASQIDFLLAGNDSWVAGTAEFFAAGTTTPKTIWLDRTKATPADNPYQLDIYGTAHLFADGLYKVVIKNAAGTVVYTHDNLAFSLQDGPWVDVSEYASLTAAVAAIGSTKTDLLINSATTCTANTVVPATIRIRQTVSGTINQGAYTLTLNGSASLSGQITGTGAVTINGAFDATDGVFASGLSVTFGNSAEVRPEMWVMDGVNDHVELQSAVDSIRARGGVVSLKPGKTYNTTTRVNIYDNITVNGNNSVLSMVAAASQYSVFGIIPYGANTSVSNVVLRDVSMSWATNNEPNAPTDPILVDRGINVILERLRITNAKDNAIELWESRDVTIRQCRLVTPAFHGVSCPYSPPTDKRCYSFTVEDCYIEPTFLAVDAQLKDAASLAVIKSCRIVNANGVTKNQGNGTVIFENNYVHLRDSQDQIAFNMASPNWVIRGNRILNAFKPMAFTNNVEDATRQLGNVIISDNYFGPTTGANLSYILWFRNNSKIKNVTFKGNIFDYNESRANSDSRKYIFAQPVSGTVLVENLKMDGNTFFIEAFNSAWIFDLDTNFNTASYFDMNNNLFDLKTTNSVAANGRGVVFNAPLKWSLNQFRLPASASGWIDWAKSGSGIIINGQSSIETSVTDTPTSYGQIAINSGNIYMSKGVSGSGDWLKVSP